jgi:hypothetical protein
VALAATHTSCYCCSVGLTQAEKAERKAELERRKAQAIEERKRKNTVKAAELEVTASSYIPPPMLLLVPLLVATPGYHACLFSIDFLTRVA